MMNMREAREKKEELKTKLENLIIEFEELTGLRVNKVNIQPTTGNYMSDPTTRHKLFVGINRLTLDIEVYL